MSATTEDRVLLCADCGGSFVWTAGEQAFFTERGLTEPPRRCEECRRAKHDGHANMEKEGGKK